MDSVESREITPEQPDSYQLLPHEREFAFALERLRSLPLREMPDLASRVDHTGNIIAPDPQYALESGVYLRRPSPFLREAGDDSAGAGLEYIAQPLAEMGRKTQIGDSPSTNESHHGTFFGILRTDADDWPGGQENVAVAIKPMEHNERSPVDATLQELAMLEHVADCDLPTLEVLGLIVDNESNIPKSYIITRRNPQIRSLDTLDWSEEAENVDQHLQTAIATLTSLHSNLIFHKDLEFKNISSLDREGSFIVYDMEWSVSLRDLIDQSEVPDIERLGRAIDFDLGTVRRSMRKILYPNLPADGRPNTEQETFDYELTHLYEPYYLALMNTDSKYKGDLDKAYHMALARRHESIAGTK
jgi:hypothetical protein